MSHASQPAPQRQEARLALALMLLREGAEDAREFRADIWDFAVEIDRLQACGVTNNDLRRLMRAGLVEHRLESRSLRDTERHFRPIPNQCFTKRSCFVLSAAGRSAATAHLEKQATPNGAVRPYRREAPSPEAAVPCWDDDLRQLRVGENIVQEFRQPSSRQVAVLSAFQSQGWPPRIDDPLNAADAAEVHGLLHFTIQNLNRNQLRKLIHFSGDGTRRGVCWRLLTD